MKKLVGNKKLPQKSKGNLRSRGVLQNIQLNHSLQSQLFNNKDLPDLLSNKLSLPSQRCSSSSSLGDQGKFRNQAMANQQMLSKSKQNNHPSREDHRNLSHNHQNQQNPFNSKLLQNLHQAQQNHPHSNQTALKRRPKQRLPQNHHRSSQDLPNNHRSSLHGKEGLSSHLPSRQGLQNSLLSNLDLKSHLLSKQDLQNNHLSLDLGSHLRSKQGL